MHRMTVEEVDVRGERRRKRLKAVAITVAAAVVLGSAAGLTWYFTPPALPETLEQAEAVVDSPRFTRLSSEAKQPYLDVIREQFGSLDREERRAMIRENEQMREAFRASRNAEREAFTKAYVLATPEERLAMMAEREAERGDRRGDGQRGDRGGEGGGGPSNDRINDRMTTGSAQSSQLRAEMRRERRNR
ncbi:MAG: hypothetical protein AAGH99_02120 [Planctomycetota bacterium]